MKRALLCLLPALLGCTEDDGLVIRRRDAGSSSSSSGSFCVEECQLTADCVTGYQCENNRCTRPDPPEARCTYNIECIARASGWPACEQNLTCVNVQDVCVDGEYCARRRSSTSECITGTEEMTLDKADETGSVTVCGRPRERCGADRRCFTACALDEHCAGEQPVCNVSSGKCECTQSSCRTNASVCTAGQCRCASDADCTLTSDHCYEGACGCVTTSVCTGTRAHPNTQWVCE